MPHLPLSTPPPRRSSWWRSVPGQLALVAMLLGGIIICAGAFGWIGPHAR